jgi:hypothetical protein
MSLQFPRLCMIWPVVNSHLPPCSFHSCHSRFLMSLKQTVNLSALCHLFYYFLSLEFFFLVVNKYKIVVVLMDCIVLKQEKLLK